MRSSRATGLPPRLMTKLYPFWCNSISLSHERRAWTSVKYLVLPALRGPIVSSRLLEVEIRLQAHPVARRIAKVLRETQRCVGRDTALAQNDLVDATRRHADIARQRVLAQAARLQELLEENDAGVVGTVVSFHSYNAARYITQSVIAQVVIISDRKSTRLNSSHVSISYA